MNEITIRCGLKMTYEVTTPTHIVVLLQPRLGWDQRMEGEQLVFPPPLHVATHEDIHGNIVRRCELPPGQFTIQYDSLIAVSSLPENIETTDGPLSVEDMPPDILRYTLPSRYCDSDRLMDFAFREFGQVQHGLARVQAICDWIHNHIEYRWGSGDPLLSASEALGRGYGICRDFAHIAIALCRCFNIPARYVTGHLPDVAYPDSGIAMDFHAYMQVYVGGRWNTFDARFNVPRIGRIDIACGFDAVDCAFSTHYGAARLTWFEVWNYQVDPDVVRLGDPVDMTLRLDGTPELRFAGR